MIKNTTYYYYSQLSLWMILVLVLFVGCTKDNSDKDALLIPSSIKILQDDFSDRTLDLVPGDGVMLAVYTTIEEKVICALLTNEGEVIWRRDIGVTTMLYPLFSSSDMRIEEIIYEGNGVFSIMGRSNGDGRIIKINTEGEIVSDQSNFFTLTNGYHRFGVFKDKAQNYISYGFTGTGRSFLSKHTPSGDLIFRNIFSETSGSSFNDNQAVTGCVQLESGEFVLAGTYTPSNLAEFASVYFIRKFTSDGEEVWYRRYELDPIPSATTLGSGNNIFGRDLILNPDGTFSFLMNDADRSTDRSKARLIKFSSEGNFLSEQFIDLATTNLIGGNSLSPENPNYQGTIGQSLVQKADGSYVGIVNRYDESGTQFGSNLRTPHFPYIFELDQGGNLVNMQFSDRVYSTFYSTCVSLSNGKTAIFGRIISIGETSKPLIIIQE